jgi:Ca-activated chloride channel family protein
MSQFTYAHPAFFYLFLLFIPMIGWYVWQQKKSRASIQISTLKGFEAAPRTWKHYLRHLLFVFQLGVLSLLIMALARPQSTSSWENATTEGIDIIIALDISSSMLARDFQPDRLDAAKNVAIQFISGRPYDRIGLVVFAGESFTQCPLTTDHAVLINLFKDIHTGMIEDGTAIGEGLATAVARLKDSKAKSKVVILLTDGENNRGEIAPVTAAEIAKTFGVRVYTIGVGTIGTAPYPVQTPFGMQMRNMEVKIDEPMLKQIAQITDGEYFRATDNATLKSIYKHIDQLEKSKIAVKQFSRKTEEFERFAIPAMLLALLLVFLKNTIFRNIP